MPDGEHELIRPDARIRYRTRGPEAAPPVVFLHGSTLDGESWAGQVEALEQDYRVVVPDLRGHGASTMDGRFEFEAAVEDVLAVLDEIDAERVALVGLSLGGNIAQEIVYRCPERVDALVVADATCNTAPRNPLQVPMTISYLAAQTMTSRNRFLQRAAAATAQDEEVQQYVLDVNENRSVAETLQILVSLVNDALHPDPEYRLPVPTLLIHGDGDRIGDIVGSTRGWAAREPLADYVVVPDAGHVSNQDNPEAFNAALTAFLAEALRPATTVPDDGGGDRMVRPQRRLWDRLRRHAS
jgi:pimeloyl-ACP methyl ester carboxylesterase